MGVTLQRKLSSYSLLPHHHCHKTSSASSMYCQSCWQSSDIFCKSSFKTDVWYHVSHFNVWVYHLAILLKYSFWFSRWDMRFCISNKLPGNVGAPWPWTTPQVMGLHTEKCTSHKHTAWGWTHPWTTTQIKKWKITCIPEDASAPFESLFPPTSPKATTVDF